MNTFVDTRKLALRRSLILGDTLNDVDKKGLPTEISGVKIQLCLQYVEIALRGREGGVGSFDQGEKRLAELTRGFERREVRLEIKELDIRQLKHCGNNVMYNITFVKCLALGMTATTHQQAPNSFLKRQSA